MELNKLYDIAENENIKIYNHELDYANGIFVNINNINAIALDYKKFDTSTKEKCVLAEELRSLLSRRNLLPSLFRCIFY